eukprot:2550932-Lingulodinium_polyedra.AAC.1
MAHQCRQILTGAHDLHTQQAKKHRWIRHIAIDLAHDHGANFNHSILQRAEKHRGANGQQAKKHRCFCSPLLYGLTVAS